MKKTVLQYMAYLILTWNSTSPSVRFKKEAAVTVAVERASGVRAMVLTPTILQSTLVHVCTCVVWIMSQ